MSPPSVQDHGSRLSIGLLSPGWPLPAFPNGIVTYVDTLVPSLRKMGHRVSILAGQVAGVRDPSVYDLARFVSARSMPQRLIDALAARIAPRVLTSRQVRRALVAAARTMVSEGGVDVVEAEESFGTAAWLKEGLSVPVCVRLHGPWFLNGPALAAPEDDGFRERVRMERLAIARADGITAPSRDVLDRVRAHYGLELAGAEVIPYPVARPPADQRWRLDACDRERVLFVGRFDRHKGGDVVLEAFGEVMRAIPRARLSFVGPDRGVVTDDGRTWTLPEFVRDRLPGALETGRVEWLGQLPSTALASLRLRALVTIVASRYETFCYAAAETMALGCPIVATRVGGMTEFVMDGINGLLCRPEDPRDLAGRIIELMTDPRRAAALARQGALDCERLLHPDVIAARMVAFYRRVLAGKPGHGPPPEIVTARAGGSRRRR
jgi:glycosyltransferase involved in cell wall biosynthesis